MKCIAMLSLASIFIFVACQYQEKTSDPVQSLADSAGTDHAEKKTTTGIGPASVDITSWPRKNAAEIGCILESALIYRDSIFNCSLKKYINKGDPCKHTEAYYEGPQLPDQFAARLHPLVKQVLLDFEGGRLREINITFSDSVSIDKIREWFKLPRTGAPLPENIMSIEYGENVFDKLKPIDPAYTRWLTITGFEHMGAADVDCD